MRASWANLLVFVFMHVSMQALADGGGIPPHLVGLFYGTGKQSGSTKDATTLGFRYTMSQSFIPGGGFGAAYDTISADSNSTRITVMAVFFPFADSHVAIGPGIRMLDSSNKNILYFEAGYSFVSNGVYLTPIYSYEFIGIGGDTITSIGARLGMGL